MTTYNYLKLTGCLLIASCVSFGAAAQQANPAPENTDATAGYVVSQNNSPASIERIRVENLHFSHSENASGIQLDPIGYYSEASLGFDREKGSLKRVQEGADNTAYSFSTDGGGHLAGLHDMYVWGRFSYTRKNLKDAQYNATLFDPLRGTPFYVADPNKSKWINQLFDMEVKAASPVLWKRVVFGVGLNYQNGQAAKQLDPRPLTTVSKFDIKPGITVLLGEKHALGGYYRYYSRREDGNASNSVSLVYQTAYVMNFPGFFIANEIGPLSGDSQRIYNANCMGGGGEYTFRSDAVQILLSGNYSQEVEDVTNSYTTPKMTGTTIDERYSIALNTSFKLSPANALFVNLSYDNRSIDGIQYVQEYDNSFEVAKWIIKSKSIRSNSSSAYVRGSLQYMRTTRQNAYDWTVGVDLVSEKLDDIYYFPRSTQNVKNFSAKIFGRKNFIIGSRHSLLVGLNVAMKSNSDSAIDYNGDKADTQCYQDFTLRDFYSLGTGYTAFGAEITYALSEIFGPRGSLFVAATTDYFKAKDHKELFNDRLLASFKVGFMF